MGCSCLISVRVLVTLKAGGTSGAPLCCQSEAQRCLQRDRRRAYREESNHEGLVYHQSAVRRRDSRDDPDLTASNAAWSRAACR
jgi:hypothetical protein